MKLAAILLLALLLVAAIAAGFWLYTPDKPRAELEAKYLNAPGDYLDVAGLRLHVRDSGPRDAPVVIMLHGFGAGLHTWEPWAQALTADHRVIRFDLPGFGLSGADPGGDYSDQHSVQVLAALMDRLGIARASLIDNSIGGKFAWMFAAHYPSRVDPSLAPAYGDPAVLTDDLVTRYRDLMLAPGIRDAMIVRMEQVMLEDPEPRLRGIRAPTPLLWGEKDATIPISNAADCLRDLPQATLVALPGLGHVPQEEAPAVALAPVQAFLAR